MTPKRQREVVICEGRMSVRSLKPLSPCQGPPIPRMVACALAGTALAAVLIVSPSELTKKSPPQTAYETVVAVRELASDNLGVTLPPAPPVPPKVLMTDNATKPTPITMGGGAVRASFTVVNP